MTDQFPDDPLGAALFGELLEDLDQDDDESVEADDSQEEVTDDDPPSSLRSWWSAGSNSVSPAGDQSEHDPRIVTSTPELTNHAYS
jgi:hypothetical protein